MTLTKLSQQLVEIWRCRKIQIQHAKKCSFYVSAFHRSASYWWGGNVRHLL